MTTKPMLAKTLNTQSARRYVPRSTPGYAETVNRRGPLCSQATTKERMLQLRQENQRLRKSVPIDFGERKEEEGAKISLHNLLFDLKQKQPQK